jgi:hypothetical protein
MLFLLGTCSILQSYSQSDSLELLLRNDSIKFEVVYTSVSILKDQTGKPRGNFVKIAMSDNLRKYLLRIESDTSFWMKHLANDNSDWGTNLVLYYLHGREAGLIRTVPTRNQWLQFKPGEIDYWRTFLSSRLPNKGLNKS